VVGAEQRRLDVVEVERVLSIARAQDEVVESIVPQHLRHGGDLEDVAGLCIDPGNAVVQEVHRLVSHPVPSTIGDVPSTRFPPHRAHPQITIRTAVDGVVEAQAVLAPLHIGGGIEPEQG